MPFRAVFAIGRISVWMGLSSQATIPDGVTSEQDFFRNYLNTIRTRVTDPTALAEIQQDPSGDDFKFYLGDEADQQKYIVARYKRFMGMENNSPENTSTNQYLTPASSTLPDIEDLNIDNTINDNEALLRV